MIDIESEVERLIEEFCECGLDEKGQWSETIFEEFGCNCREELTPLEGAKTWN